MQEATETKPKINKVSKTVPSNDKNTRQAKSAVHQNRTVVHSKSLPAAVAVLAAPSSNKMPQRQNIQLQLRNKKLK